MNGHTRAWGSTNLHHFLCPHSLLQIKDVYLLPDQIFMFILKYFFLLLFLRWNMNKTCADTYVEHNHKFNSIVFFFILHTLTFKFIFSIKYEHLIYIEKMMPVYKSIVSFFFLFFFVSNDIYFFIVFNEEFFYLLV